MDQQTDSWPDKTSTQLISTLIAFMGQKKHPYEV